MSIPVFALMASGVLAVVMVGLWIVQRRTGDAGVVDVAWSAGIGLAALAGALWLEGEGARRWLVAAMAMAWSARLSLYLLRDRVLNGEEDGRYQQLRADWGAAFQRRLFLFFQVQAALSVAFALPVLVAMSAPREGLDALDLAALLVWLGALTGESVADRQLETFRADPANRGRTCRRGLWRYSRHPNYFFEWLHWWAYTLAAVGSDLWWLTVAAPLVMLVFVLKVTGIPPTEARALASRGDDYRDYQRTTSAFVPWFPKDGAAEEVKA